MLRSFQLPRLVRVFSCGGPVVCWSFGLILVAALLLPAPAAHAQAGSSDDGEQWSDQFGGEYGFDGPVETIAVGEVGLFVGGRFTGVKGNRNPDVEPGSMVAEWTGASWDFFVDAAEVRGVVYASAVVEGNLYVGGAMWTGPRDQQGEPISVARWDGTEWHSLGVTGSGGRIRAMTVLDGDVYVAGEFDSLGGTAAQNVARWDGSRWHAVGEGLQGSEADRDQGFALTADAEELYTVVSLAEHAAVLRWGGARWDTLATWDQGRIYAMQPMDERLYVGGSFYNAERGVGYTVARWDGTRWHASGDGPAGFALSAPEYPAEVQAFVIFEGDLYAAGDFTHVGGRPTGAMARWDGATWSAIDWTGPHPIGDLAVDESGIYAVVNDHNNTSLRGGEGAVIKWDGRQWHALDGPNAGTNGSVHALAVSGATTYVGGSFTTAGDEWVSGIAAWTGEAWQSLGEGVNGTVYDIAVDGDAVYVGGVFTEAGGEPVNYVAKWDGQDWEPLGTGVDTTVQALALWDGTVYAGIMYEPWLTGPPVLRWDGAQWEGLGPKEYAYGSVPRNGSAALAIVDDVLYAGGERIELADGTTAPLARWNGTAWEAAGEIGGFPNAPVRALAVAGSTLYASRGGVHRWMGSDWEEVPIPYFSSGDVESLAEHGSALYVGGSFRATYDGRVFNAIVRVQDGVFERLGDGLVLDDYPFPDAGVVRDIAVRDDGTVVVGGDFLSAGEHSANNFAIWSATGSTSIDEVPRTAAYLAAPYPNPSRKVTHFRFAVPSPGRVQLEVYDVLGRRVAVAADEWYAAGEAEVVWQPEALPAGSYFVRLQSSGTVRTQRLVWLGAR